MTFIASLKAIMANRRRLALYGNEKAVGFNSVYLVV